MIALRSQRLQEELAKQEQQQQMMRMGQQAASQIGGALVGAAQNRQQDAVYNRIANQINPPRAEAADPDVAARMSQMGMGGTKPFAGGKEEFIARMKMAQTTQGMLAQRALADQRKIQTAKTAMDMSSKPFQDKFKNDRAYSTNADVYQEAINKALETNNPEMYQNAVSNWNGLYRSLKETNPNTNIPPPTIPPFVTPEQRQAIQRAQQNLSQLRAAPPAEGSWIPETAGQIPGAYGAIARKMGLGGVDMPGQTAKEAIAEQQAKIAQAQKDLMAMPGAKEYLANTPQATATPGAGAITGNRAGQIVNGRPLGQKIVHQTTGETLIWNGTKFVKPE